MSDPKTRLRDLLNSILPALIEVESGGNPNKRGAAGEVGILQIRQICVDDVNRILGSDCFTLWMALKNTRAIDIAHIYLQHWGAHYESETMGPATAEVLARIWNGGPDGWAKESTLKYWHKVQAVLQKEGNVKGGKADDKV